MSWETVKDFVERVFVMKNNSFLKIRIRMSITIYIVCALSGDLGGALCSYLYGALSGNYRVPHSTPKKSLIFISFQRIKTVSAIHKKEGFMNYTKKYMSRWIGLYLPFWLDSSAHRERKKSNEISKKRIIYGYLY